MPWFNLIVGNNTMSYKRTTNGERKRHNSDKFTRGRIYWKDSPVRLCFQCVCLISLILGLALGHSLNMYTDVSKVRHPLGNHSDSHSRTALAES